MHYSLTSLLAVFLIISKSSLVWSQPPTEIYLFDLDHQEGIFQILNPRNITNHKGYDNQPYFINDEKLVFSASFGDQTDIVMYDILAQTQLKLTNTPESEFSPKPTNKGKYISAVVLENDDSQYITKFPIKGGEPKIIPSKQKIGYYCWLDKKTVFSYVVGSPPSLQEWNTKNSQFKIIMMNPGRSLERIPNQKAISFIHKESDSMWYVNSYNPYTDKVTLITEIPIGTEDIAWQKDGILFASNQMQILKYDPSKDNEWITVGNMGDFNLKQASRIAISPNGKMIAIAIDE